MNFFCMVSSVSSVDELKGWAVAYTGDLPCALEFRVPGAFVRILELKVNVVNAQQRPFRPPEPEARIFEVDVGRHFIALRGDQLALKLQQVVRRRHPDAKAHLLV